MENTVVVIPTYNEADNIKEVIDKVLSFHPNISILVVDDSSPDGTAKIVKDISSSKPNVKLLIREKKEGLGKAYMDAFKRLIHDDSYSKIITMDADFSHDPSYISEMLRNSTDHDLVIASRYIGDGSGIDGWVLWRRILSRFGNTYCRVVTGMPINDFTAGFMLINKKLITEEKLNSLDLSGYAFLIELKYIFWKEGAKIKEIPIILQSRRGGESKLSNSIIGEGIKAPWKMILKKRI